MPHRLAAAIAGISAISAGVIADPGPLLVRVLVPPEPPVDIGFGYSVAVEGPTAVVGAPRARDFGDQSGAVYVYDAATADLRFRLTTPVPVSRTQFGAEVETNGSLVFVTAGQGEGFVSDEQTPGRVYAFDAFTGELVTWFEAEGVSLADPGNGYGSSLAVSGNTLIIGASHQTTNRWLGGAVFLVNLDTFEQTAVIIPPGQRERDFFGTRVAVDGDRLLVTSPGDDDGVVDGGSAMLYGLDGVRTSLLLPEPAVFGKRFGRSIAASDGVGFITDAHSQQLQVIDLETGVRIGTLDERTDRPGGFSGYSDSVAASNGIAVATNMVRGEAHFFTIADRRGFAQVGKRLRCAPCRNAPTLGSSLAVSADRVLVGADAYTEAGTRYEGAVFVFRIPCSAADLADPTGMLTFADLNALATAYRQGEELADIDRDGSITVEDLAAFVDAFVAGCR
jgi:hypothetical protein